MLCKYLARNLLSMNLERFIFIWGFEHDKDFWFTYKQSDEQQIMLFISHLVKLG